MYGRTSKTSVKKSLVISLSVILIHKTVDFKPNKLSEMYFFLENKTVKRELN